MSSQSDSSSSENENLDEPQQGNVVNYIGEIFLFFKFWSNLKEYNSLTLSLFENQSH